MVSIEARAKERVRVIQARVRRFVYFGVLIGLAWFFWRYDFITIPANYNHLAPQHMPAGATVVAIDYDDQVTLGIGSVLLFEPPGHPGSNAFGVVAGLPGEMLVLTPTGEGRGRIEVGGRKELLPLPKKTALKSGVIPADHFLILSGDRLHTTDSTAADSRVFGLVPRANLRAKIITSLNPFAR